MLRTHYFTCYFTDPTGQTPHNENTSRRTATRSGRLHNLSTMTKNQTQNPQAKPQRAQPQRLSLYLSLTVYLHEKNDVTQNRQSQHQMLGGVAQGINPEGPTSSRDTRFLVELPKAQHRPATPVSGGAAKGTNIVPRHQFLVELDGIEPTTSCLQSRRSPN